VNRVAAIILAALAAVVLASAAAGSTAALPGLMTSKAPWPANNRALLHARLQKIGMPALRAEGQRLHTHQHLDVVVNGSGYPVPVGIGIDAHERFIAPLHTHDYSGIMHVESPVVRKFTLGEFFDVWGLRFSSKCLGGYCAKGKRKVWVFVNGTLVLGNPRALALRQHQEIVVAYGTYASIPKPIPPFYPFPQGL
jgi:hypothetical protein